MNIRELYSDFLDLCFDPVGVKPGLEVVVDGKLSKQQKALIKTCLKTAARLNWNAEIKLLNENTLAESYSVLSKLEIRVIPGNALSDGNYHNLYCGAGYIWGRPRFNYFNEKVFEVLKMKKTVKHHSKKGSPYVWTQDGALTISYPKAKRGLFMKILKEGKKKEWFE